ncbi:hypothetical protein EZI54_16535 [Marinobacter halodurans]|uniref:Response regulatory domain-containing protein n=1 Tax=Marinobacter halodurans TaxID=2528979 RepID=A0ABY1ZJC4_9GAMM|nr:hypothetical protein [Marinobacter halodurans]TBW51847.1 hypothetical protein EZI54_16535 [Marinobacter halodurans]
MDHQDIIVCITDDLGIRVWLERALQDAWRLECVGNADLSRVVNLVEATRARLAIVAIDENAPERSLRTIEAVHRAHPSLVVITVARRLNQEYLLRSMRAGARDCLLADSDAEELRAQVNDLLYREQVSPESRQRDALPHNLTLVAPADPTVDTRFLTQNLAFALNRDNPDQRILAIDTAAEGRNVFYLEVNNRFTLKNFLANANAADETLIETALEEYREGLRLLGGQLDDSDLGGDRNADLFIVISQLMHLFDHIVVNVDPAVADHWIGAVGPHTSTLVMTLHPIVYQAHRARRQIERWRSSLGTACRQVLVADGADGKVSPTLTQLEETIGIEALGALPLDWNNRLLTINAGIPLHRLPRKNAYARQFEHLLKRFNGPQNHTGEPSTTRGTGLLQRLRLA